MSRTLARVTLALILAGCGGSNSPADGGSSPSMDGGAPPAVSDAGQPPGDAAPAPRDAVGGDLDGGSVQTDGGGPAPRESVFIRIEHPLLETDGEAIDRTAIACGARFDTGLPMEDPGDWEISVGGEGVVVDGERYGFTERGSYPVTCHSPSLDLSGTAEIVVVYELTDRNVVRLAAINARAESELNDALAGVVGGEIESVHAAGAELSVLHEELMAIDFARSPRMLVEHPAGMPTAADARDAGISAHADDPAFGAALIAARDALAGVRAVYESLSVDSVSMAEATRFAEANDRLRDALAALETLDPSAIAVLENLPAIDQLVTEELVANARETLSFLGAFLAAAELAPGDGGEVATLIGAAASIATQSALSTLPSYSGILTSVGKSAIGMGILMAARGLIREAFPPALDGPQVVMVFGSAGGFVSPGVEWYAEIVNADLDIPSNNQMIIIPTTAADFLTEITGIAGDFNSALTAFDDHWLKRAKALYDAMNGLRDAANAAAGVGEGIVLTGQAVGSLNMIQFPAQTGFNCDGLVRNTYVVPVRLGVGFGEPYQVIVPAECSITGCPAGCEVGW